MIACPEPLQRIARMLPVPLYVVGGYVRNQLLWGEARTTDIDVCAALTVPQLQQALNGLDVEVIAVNPRVGTVLLRYRGQKYEYTTFRQDSYPIGGQHTPDSVRFVATPQEDAFRRDFRINALYCDVRTGEVLDPTGGLEDLARRTVQCTRSAQEVFAEDGLRLLRLARFCAELGFVPHPDTFDEARRYVKQLSDISWERRRDELSKILLADTKYAIPNAHDSGIALLDAMGAWPYLVGGELSAAGALRYFPARLPVRLAGLCRVAARAMGQDRIALAQRCLGQDGLRYSNATVKETVRILQAEETPQNEEDWRLWAAQYGDIVTDVAALWNDAEKARWAQEVTTRLHDSGAPLRPQDLPVSAKQLQRWGVSKNKLGAVRQQLVQWCIRQLCRPDAEQCAQEVARLVKENEWN